MVAVFTPSVFEVDARQVGLRRTNTAAQNASALQDAIDSMGSRGGTIVVREPYPCNPITLRKNVSITGDAGPRFKGPSPYDGGSPGLSATPGGPSFLITDTSTSFLTLEGCNTVADLLFHYPNQLFNATNGDSLINYPVTIVKAPGKVNSLAVRGCSFVGATGAIAFVGSNFSDDNSFDIEIDLCYGYPLGSTPLSFINLAYVFDIPRITRCHVNPTVGLNFLGERTSLGNLPIRAEAIDHVCLNSAPTYRIEITDEFVIDTSFVFGAKTGFYVVNSYGTLSQCNADMVQIGFDLNPNASNKYIALLAANAIPSAGPTTGRYAVNFGGSAGFLKLIGCHAFIGSNPAVPSSSNSSAQAFLHISGSNSQRVDLFGCTESVISGSWAEHIDNDNASAVAHEFPTSS